MERKYLTRGKVSLQMLIVINKQIHLLEVTKERYGLRFVPLKTELELLY